MRYAAHTPQLVALRGAMRFQVAQNPRVFPVKVLFGDAFYTAVCEEIGLVTEAETYGALIERANLIAPEIAELNGFLGPFALDFQPDPKT